MKIWFGLDSYNDEERHRRRRYPSDLPASVSSVAVNAAYGVALTGAGREGGIALQPTTNDAAYLLQLCLIRGHLNVGFDLYQQGALDDAKTHMKHPGDEIYTSLEPALVKYGVAGFAEEIDRLAMLVKQEAPLSDVKAAYSDVKAAIEAAESGVSGADLQTKLKVVTKLTRIAAEEYETGVKNGVIVDAREYQDAFGFVRIARKVVNAIDPGSNDSARIALQDIKKQLQSLEPAWPGVIAPKTVKTDASLLYGAAARIEIAALSVK